MCPIIFSTVKVTGVIVASFVPGGCASDSAQTRGTYYGGAERDEQPWEIVCVRLSLKVNMNLILKVPTLLGTLLASLTPQSLGGSRIRRHGNNPHPAEKLGHF